MSDKFLDRVNDQAKTAELYNNTNKEDVAKFLGLYIEPLPIPTSFEPVLALITVISELEKSEWYEVVYHTGEDWASYAGSKTFNDGERVLIWKYCKELL